MYRKKYDECIVISDQWSVIKVIRDEQIFASWKHFGSANLFCVRLFISLPLPMLILLKVPYIYVRTTLIQEQTWKCLIVHFYIFTFPIVIQYFRLLHLLFISIHFFFFLFFHSKTTIVDSKNICNCYRSPELKCALKCKFITTLLYRI